MNLLGEEWTEDDLHDARHVLSSVFEGVDAAIGYTRMLELQARGLVSDVTAKPGRGRYAGRYEFLFTDKLEHLVKASRA